MVHWGFGFTYRSNLPFGPVVVHLDAYERHEDEGVTLCRPCSTGDRVQGHMHACDGPPCECALCRTDELGFMDVVEEMSRDWDLRDKEDSWRDQR